MIQTISSASEGRSIQDLTPQSGLEWILGTEPLAVCFACDATLPAETTKCPICDCETSIVRRCPGCRRIVSAQHTYCIYCSMSFLRRGHVASRSLILPAPRRPSRPSSDQYGGVVEATMMVALLVLSGFFAYTYFWRYARVERSAQAATPPVAPISSAARERSARRARIVRPAPPLGDAAVSAPAVLPLPPPPPLPLRFTIVGGYEPPPLPLTHDSSDKSRGGP